MLGIRLKTVTGRYSNSQLWQIVAMVTHCVTAAALVAMGLPPQYVPIANMVIGIVQGIAAMRLRTTTNEPMANV